MIRRSPSASRAKRNASKPAGIYLLREASSVLGAGIEQWRSDGTRWGGNNLIEYFGRVTSDTREEWQYAAEYILSHLAQGYWPHRIGLLYKVDWDLKQTEIDVIDLLVLAGRIGPLEEFSLRAQQNPKRLDLSLDEVTEAEARAHLAKNRLGGAVHLGGGHLSSFGEAFSKKADILLLGPAQVEYLPGQTGLMFFISCGPLTKKVLVWKTQGHLYHREQRLDLLETMALISRLPRKNPQVRVEKKGCPKCGGDMVWVSRDVFWCARCGQGAEAPKSAAWAVKADKKPRPARRARRNPTEQEWSSLYEAGWLAMKSRDAQEFAWGRRRLEHYLARVLADKEEGWQSDARRILLYEAKALARQGFKEASDHCWDRYEKFGGEKWRREKWAASQMESEPKARPKVEKSAPSRRYFK